MTFIKTQDKKGKKKDGMEKKTEGEQILNHVADANKVWFSLKVLLLHFAEVNSFGYTLVHLFQEVQTGSVNVCI